MEQDIIVRVADWADESDQNKLREIRETVFIQEQQVPVEMEWDEIDAIALHLLAFDRISAQVLGVARLYPSQNKYHIGRMAVLKPYRNKGVGSTLLRKLIAIALEKNMLPLELSAQTHAVEFYLKHGFSVYGDEFLEAGIPHCHMRYTQQH